MTYEKSTRTNGRPVAIEPTNGVRRYRQDTDERVFTNIGRIRKEYDWDNSYLLKSLPF